MESEFEIEMRKIPGQCCPEVVKTACRSDGKLYKPGEKWRSLTNSCIVETCVAGPNMTKHTEIEVCAKQCAQVKNFILLCIYKFVLLYDVLILY